MVRTLRDRVTQEVRCGFHLVTVAVPGAEPSLEHPAGMLREAGLQVITQALYGEPEGAISAYVSAAGIDLLVMGAYGHTRISALLVGSTTTALLRACRVPVLVFR